MSGRPDDFDESARLISGLLEGRLEGSDRTRLEARLERDPAVRRLYLQMVDQEIELRTMAARDGNPDIISLHAELEREAADRRLQRRQWWLLGLLAAGAAAAAVVLLWPAAPVPEKPGGPAIVKTVADAWSADFENGTAPGWYGTFVSSGLPPGSTRGIAAARRNYPYGTFWVIELPSDWEDGLVSLTARSTLHLTFRLGEPASFDVFLHTIEAPGQYMMHRLTGSKFPGTAGRWQTMSIPFSLFEKKVPDPATGQLNFNGGSPTSGERITSLVFTAQNPVDLVIDRLWISPDGTGIETIEPLQ